MNKLVLEKVGFSHYNADDFYSKKVKLRKGKSTTVWVHKYSGHGILDPENWVPDSYYDEEYREEFSANYDGKKNQTDKHFETFKELNKKQFDFFSDLLNKDTKFLEIGPSHGGILDLVIQKNIRSYDVVEPNKNDSQYLKDKYPDAVVHDCLLEDTKLLKNNYDVAVSFEVLEHVLNPKKFLAKIHQSLRQKGNLILEVPNHDDVLLSCYDPEINYKDFYYHKAHIHYFTATSLEEICKISGFSGEVKSFLMYPFFNHVFWHHNSGPQAHASLALQTPVPTLANTKQQIKINDFYKKVQDDYEEMINTNFIGDCLLYRGIKK